MRILPGLVISAAMVLGEGGACGAEPADPIIGTWRLNLNESIPPQGQKFNEYTVVVRSTTPNLNYTYYDVDDKGGKIEFTYNAPADGRVRDLPGIPGLKGSMTRLPSGIIDAKLWNPDGSVENKFCIVGGTLRKQTCLATVTQPDGSVVFFKQVLDKKN